jgi:lysophospholipase L1-like esterase
VGNLSGITCKMMNQEKGIFIKSLIAIILAIVFSLAVAEVSLRTAQAIGLMPNLFDMLGRAKPPLDRLDGPGMYYAHPHSAYALKPNYRRGNFEKINSLGFRGEEITLKKPPGVYRIVAIGGSTTFGVYLPHNETYPYFLQRKLREDFNTPTIEVVNAGLTGSTTAESLHRLFTQVLPIQPDMVIIYHGYNDLFPRVFDNYQNDYYHFRKSDPNNPPGLSRFLVWRLALRALNPMAFVGDYDLTSIIWQIKNLSDSDSVRMENFYTSDAGAFEQNLEFIVTTLRANSVQPVLATFAIHPDTVHWNDYIPPYLWEEGIRQNNDAINRVAEKYNVPLVPFAERTFGLPKQNPWRKTQACCYSDSIHMTTEGNILKAEIFAETIEPIMLEAGINNN